MSAGYAAILWNKNKKKYDLILWGFIILFLSVSFLFNLFYFPTANLATIVIRSFGLLSIVLLHIILSIGPLCRINTLFLPLLYNRRHLGVSMFIVASVHALYSIFWFHGNGNISPFYSVFLSNTHYTSFGFFPFQTLGFFAYIILMLMAFTSHDFWLAALKPKVWKALHMLVYLAYALIIMHVLLGILQFENSPFVYFFLMAGLVFLSVIHIYAGYKEFTFDRQKRVVEDGWIYVCQPGEIENDRAKIVTHSQERIAVFKYKGRLSAVHNVCKHQNGPLGEGKITDGCITCPWHGYQYLPHNGCSPAPFTEKVATYRLKLVGGKLFVYHKAEPEGTFIEPLIFPEPEAKPLAGSFYIGWQGTIDTHTAKAVKSFVFSAILIGVLFLMAFSFNQNKIADSAYKYNQLAEYDGIVSNKPFPHIVFQQGRDQYGNPELVVLPLVNAWKFGADTLISDWCKTTPGGYAKIKGTVITRDGINALELSEERRSFSASGLSKMAVTVKPEYAGHKVIRGEIIDPKCYLGAMNPGEGKPHRSCAIRCISGGIMPMLTYASNGKKKYAVLLGMNGERINDEILDFVAEPVELEGTLYNFQNWDFMYINPQKIKRLLK